MGFGPKGQKALLIARAHPFTAIERSKWHSQAWTYQEKLFSHRMLIFTDEQVFYLCGKSYWCEDTVLETDDERLLRSFPSLSLWGQDRSLYPIHEAGP